MSTTAKTVAPEAAAAITRGRLSTSPARGVGSSADGSTVSRLDVDRKVPSAVATRAIIPPGPRRRGGRAPCRADRAEPGCRPAMYDVANASPAPVALTSSGRAGTNSFAPCSRRSSLAQPCVTRTSLPRVPSRRRRSRPPRPRVSAPRDAAARPGRSRRPGASGPSSGARTRPCASKDTRNAARARPASRRETRRERAARRAPSVRPAARRHRRASRCRRPPPPASPELAVERERKVAVDVALQARHGRAELDERRQERVAVVGRAARDDARRRAQPAQGACAVIRAAAGTRNAVGEQVAREVADQRDHARTSSGPLRETRRASTASPKATAKLGSDAPPHGSACGWVRATTSGPPAGPCG